MVASLSVIIPTYNRRAMTVGAVRSILAQTVQPDEIIVVDDGSTDGTEDLLRSLYPSVSLLRQANRGVSAARNRGIKASRGDLIALLDSDDYFLPGKIEHQVGFMETHPEILLVHTNEHWLYNDRYRPQPSHIRRGSGDPFLSSLERCVISPSSVVVRRELFDRVGKFDETMPACEDYDLWLRTTAHFQVGYIDEPLLVKRGGRSDQLSKTQPALDYWRIHAITKLLRETGLEDGKRAAALEALKRKCRIYAGGRRKRNREDWRFFRDLPDLCRDGDIPAALPPLRNPG